MSETREEMVTKALRSRGLPGDRRVTWMDMVEQAAIENGVDARAVVARCRLKNVVAARRLAWRALRGAGYSYPEIAAVFGVDHTTVQAGVKRGCSP